MRFLRAFGRQSERAHKERQFARLGPIERRLISVRNFEADSRESPQGGQGLYGDSLRPDPIVAAVSNLEFVCCDARRQPQYGPSQFSMPRSATRSNSRTLSVMRVAPRLKACAAISISLPPMG